MPMIILDLDGVLTDFAGGVAALFGREAQELKAVDGPCMTVLVLQ